MGFKNNIFFYWDESIHCQVFLQSSFRLSGWFNFIWSDPLSNLNWRVMWTCTNWDVYLWFDDSCCTPTWPFTVDRALKHEESIIPDMPLRRQRAADLSCCAYWQAQLTHTHARARAEETTSIYAGSDSVKSVRDSKTAEHVGSACLCFVIPW